MTKSMIRKIIFLLSAITLCANVVGQESQKHEFSVGAMAGSMALKYKLSEGKSSSKLGTGVSFGYTYFFKKNMGLATGVEFTFYNAEIELDDFSGSHDAYDDIDLHRNFEFQYTLNDYKEKQNAFYLNVPIMLHYQFTDGEKVKFYGAGGFKVGLPISGKHKSSGANLVTQGYFPHNNVTIDDIPFRGFGSFITKPYSSQIKYKMAFILAVEVGAKWKLPKEMALYTGLYMDYGLNDINQSSKGELSLVQYNQIAPEDHIFNGIAKSSYKNSAGTTEALTSKINATSLGVKVRLAFGK